MGDQRPTVTDDLLGRRLDRRIVLKTAAGIAVASATGIVADRGVRAQDSGDGGDSGNGGAGGDTGGPETMAGTWVEEDNAGSFEAASADGRTFQTDFPFYAIAPHWSGDVDFDAHVEVRLSDDGQSWSDPLVVGEASADAGQPDRDGRHFGSLVFTGGASYVRYRGLDGNGDPVTIAGLAFTYLDPSGGPTVADLGDAALTPSVAKPPIISRAGWGCNESYRFDSKGQVIWPPEYQTVEHVIIHHTDTANFEDPLVAIRGIYYYHAVTRGWGDIGYNYLVDYMGHVYEGRYGGDNVVGGHAHQYAHGSSGIGTIGSFMNREETPEAETGLIWITAYVGRNLDPLGHADFHETANLPTICSHRDVESTDCPGDQLYADLDDIRQRVNAIVKQGVDPSPHPTYNVGDQVQITVDSANLRASPGLDFDVIAKMASGTIMTVSDGPTTNDGYTWYELTGSPGTGWSAATLYQKYVPPPPPTAKFNVGDVVAVQTDTLNLRANPSLSADILARMPFGTQGTVKAAPQAADGIVWYQLQTSYGTGWSAEQYLALADGNPPPSGGFNVGDQAQVATDRLNLRSAAGLSAAVLTQMPAGTMVTITQAAVSADGLTWYGVTSQQYGDGWCAGDFLARVGAADGIAAGDTVKVIDGTLYMRSAPGLSSDVISVLPDATQLTVQAGPTDADGYTWYQVKNDAYGPGWCAGRFLQKV